MLMADITGWALRTLQHFYGYDSFRGRQLDVITAILQHRDVLAVMPTGAGKSICYQIPACAPGINGKPALVLVITPLRALMRDQVAHLSTHGIPAAFIDSETTGTERAMTYQAAREGHIRLLYVAPERLVSPEFLRFAQTLRIRLVAVDEAHCVFQWGQDFRPDYLGIAAFIEQLPERPVIAACTATATPTVREGIIQNLHLQDPLQVISNFDRPNLYFGRYEAHSKQDRTACITQYAKTHRSESGIVYCTSRARTEELTEALKTAGVQAKYFHAKMDEAGKAYVQDAFLEGRLKVIVATTAFGMGVDKPDVRWVINDGAPSSLEEYYQEAGRAGRDGKPASCYVISGDLTNSIGKDSASRNPPARPWIISRNAVRPRMRHWTVAKPWNATAPRMVAYGRICCAILAKNHLNGAADPATSVQDRAGWRARRILETARLQCSGAHQRFTWNNPKRNTPSTPILCNPCCISSKPCTVIKAPGTALSKSSMHCMGRGAYRLWEAA